MGKWKPKSARNNLAIRGKTLNRTRLNNLTNLCGTDEEKIRIIQMYQNEFVPDGDFTIDQKIAFIICAMPSVGRMPDNVILTQLKVGPAHVNQSDYAGTHANILRTWKAKYPESAKALADMYRPNKHVPEEIRSNEDWCCLCALTNVIDYVPGPWAESGNPDMIETAVQTYQALMGWSHRHNAPIRTL